MARATELMSQFPPGLQRWMLNVMEAWVVECKNRHPWSPPGNIGKSVIDIGGGGEAA